MRWVGDMGEMGLQRQTHNRLAMGLGEIGSLQDGFREIGSLASEAEKR